MSRVITGALLTVTCFGTAFAESPDKFLDYVETDGSAYIDTGIVGKAGTKAEIGMMWKGLSSSTDVCFLGARNGSDGRFLLCHAYKFGWNLGYKANWNNPNSTYTPVLPANDARYDITTEVTSSGYFNFTVNKTTGGRDTTGQGAYDSTFTMYLFANHGKEDTSVENRCPSGTRCYYTKIWQMNGNGGYQLVRDFQPCMKDGRAGLYDDVSKEIFYGIGGDLIAPPPPPDPLDDTAPDAFVDYVESDGTQYIDTGINARSGMKAAYKLRYLDLLSDRYSSGFYFLGARNGSGQTIALHYQNPYNTSSTTCDSLFTYYGPRWQSLKQGFAIDTDYSFTTEITTAGIYNATVDGELYSKDYSLENLAGNTGTMVGPLDLNVTLYAFALNNNGAAAQRAKVRCYGLTIEQTDENGEYQLVRNFKPCIKNGIAGLYDDVSQKIFYPAVGQLRAGDATTPAKFVEYVESDGTQYIDTGVIGKPGIRAEASFVWKEIGGDVCLLGSRTADSSDTRFMPFYSFRSRMDIQYGGWSNNYDGTYATDTRYDAAASIFVGSQTLTVNGEEKVNLTKTDEVNTGLNMFVFANDIARVAKNYGKVRLYGMKIWSCDTDGAYAALVRDFRPCVSTNGVAALYDKVSGAIFYPQGGLLATGGVERAVAVTARWKGGSTVLSEAALAVATNWECFDAAGNLVQGITPSAATTVLVGQGSPLLALPAGIAVQDWAGVMLEESVTLNAAGDWSPLGVMTLANGVKINLNGNNLVSGGFTLADGTSATVENSGATATLTFAVADGKTATMTGITFADNITFAKTGVGTLSCSGFSVGYGATGAFALSDGTYSVMGGLIIGNGRNGIGTVTQTGGTLDVNGWYLTMGYLNGAYGTYTMTGGRLFVRTQPMIVGQTAQASSPSTFDLSGTGVATLMRGIQLSVHANGGTDALIVHDGGRLRTTSITKGSSENARPTLTFDGGILEPLGDVTGLLDGMPLTVGGKGFIVDTAGHNASFGRFTLTDGGELIKVGAGALTIANSPAWSSVVVSNGTLAVAAETSLTLSSVHVAKGAVLDLGGNTVRCGTLSGAGTVVNGTLIVTGTLSVAVGKPLTFTGATLDVSGAQVAVADPESITTHDPVAVATSDLAITGHARTSVSERRVQISQDGTTYTLELVRNGGFHLYIR